MARCSQILLKVGDCWHTQSGSWRCLQISFIWLWPFPSFSELRQVDLLRLGVDVFLTHGGQNSFMEALSTGVPMVVPCQTQHLVVRALLVVAFPGTSGA